MTKQDAQTQQTDPFPLSALLSQTLVAHTIELDNEFEHQMPHHTTDYGITPGSALHPWLTSTVMWFNCLRYVDDDGITVRDLLLKARTPTNLDGMRRWGYITITPDTAGAASKQPRPDAVLRLTAAGRRARELWPPLFAVIEDRWRDRFGPDAITELRAALWALVNQFEIELPDCLPILHHGLISPVPVGTPRTPAPEKDGADLALVSLLSKALLLFALTFERLSPVSMPICANVLRVTGKAGVRTRDLPLRSGVSKAAIATSLTFLARQGYAAEEAESPGSRTKLLRLTANGRRVADAYAPLLQVIEERWRERFGAATLARLTAALIPIVGAAAPDSPLMRGLEPYPDGWRAKVTRPELLPHFPMVLHRGGYPDGS